MSEEWSETTECPYCKKDIIITTSLRGKHIYGWVPWKWAFDEINRIVKEKTEPKEGE